MWLTEYNEEEIKEAFKEEGLAEGRAEGLAEGRAEGRAEGLAEGRAEGRAESVDALMSSMNWTKEQACKALNYSIEEYNSAKKAGIL